MTDSAATPVQEVAEAVEAVPSENTIVIDTNKYADGVSGNGAKTKHNGDPIATALNGLTVDEAAEIAGTLCGESAAHWIEKYAHLNVGQQRMNLGNRIRGAVNKLEKAKDGEGTGLKALEAASAAPQKAAQSRIKVAAKAAADKKAAAEKVAADKDAKAKAALKAKADAVPAKKAS